MRPLADRTHDPYAIRDAQSSAIQQYYDTVYHAGISADASPSAHLRKLAERLAPWHGRTLLDVACGNGQWLAAAARLGANTAGVDISQRAIERCAGLLPESDLRCGTAEALPFGDSEFDFVSCLGALEHFLDPLQALREMMRVAKPAARFLLLVPNAGFLPRRLGLYAGTEQNSVREEVLFLREWEELFNRAGLKVERRWRDLHVLSFDWIFRGGAIRWPLRALQALALPCWPLTWQYQIYHLCSRA